MKKMKYLYIILLVCSIAIIVEPYIQSMILVSDFSATNTIYPTLEEALGKSSESQVNGNITLICKSIAVVMMLLTAILFIYDKKSNILAKSLILGGALITLILSPSTSLISGILGITGSIVLLMSYKQNLIKID